MKFLRLLLPAAALLGVSLPAGAQDASYAREPRFKALFCYDPSAEPDHVTFDMQALDFFHRLSYGEGYTYDVVTSLDSIPGAGYQDYDIVVMLNTQPSTATQRRAFEQYMEGGGGWLGFHAAAFHNEATDWDWFRSFLGCGPFLANNWPPQPALLQCDAPGHTLTRNLPAEYICPASEFYQWNPSPRADKDVEVIYTLSPRNYPFGIKDIVYEGDFPVVWTNRRYRMLYINMGHGNQTFIDATQNLLITNAFRWVVSSSPGGDPFAPYAE